MSGTSTGFGHLSVEIVIPRHSVSRYDGQIDCRVLRPETFDAGQHRHTRPCNDVCAAPAMRCLHPNQGVRACRCTVGQFDAHPTSSFHIYLQFGTTLCVDERIDYGVDRDPTVSAAFESRPSSAATPECRKLWEVPSQTFVSWLRSRKLCVTDHPHPFHDLRR